MACRSGSLSIFSQRSTASLRQICSSRPARLFSTTLNSPLAPSSSSPSPPLASRRHYHATPSCGTPQATIPQPVTLGNVVVEAKPSSAASAAAAKPDEKPTNTMGVIRRQIVRAMRDNPGSITERYAVYGATERLCDMLCRQAAYRIDAAARKAGTVPETEDGEQLGEGEGAWFSEFGLLPTFSAWAHVAMLHMYLVVARLRACEPEVYEAWQAQLVDHFFHEAEKRMGVDHEISSGMVRQRYLKDLFVQWRGLLLAYDEGVVKGDAVLASAVWRNLYKAREDVDVRLLAGVVSFMRRCMAEFDRMDDGQFMYMLQVLGSVDKIEGLKGDVLSDIAREELENIDAPPAKVEGTNAVPETA